MVDVLVVFGSKSDEKVYNKLISELKKHKLSYKLSICSAHRTPEEIDIVLIAKSAVVIAGAGLSAALPGVIASKTVRPVIGVPVYSNYEGLDALLSIAQMPPGIPVLSVGVDRADIAALNALNMINKHESVTIIGDKENKAVKKAVDVFNEFKVKYKFSPVIDKKTVNIEFVYFDEPVEEKDSLVIYCPLLLENDDRAEAALNLLKHSQHGIWVGLNRGENAALAAIEILNIHGNYTMKLKKHRKGLKDKVKKENKEVSENVR